jgi:hypothetical protein
MQTFLPFPSAQESAYCLDNKRLGKQRVEAYQVIQALEGKYKGWTRHPAVLMWEGHIPALAQYGWTMCQEWRRRGFEDALADKFLEYIKPLHRIPWWFGYQPFHLSHRSNLLRKDPVYYGQYFRHYMPPTDLPYLWPRDGGFFTVGATKEVFVGSEPEW